MLAAPLSEDTPRSALDAMASGQAIVGYDTYYYRDFASEGAGVVTVPWSQSEVLGKQLFELSKDRELLAHLFSKSRAFALENTQEIWLDRRLCWTEQAVKAKYGTVAATVDSELSQRGETPVPRL